jgi:hypothetical protein
MGSVVCATEIAWFAPVAFRNEVDVLAENQTRLRSCSFRQQPDMFSDSSVRNVSQEFLPTRRLIYSKLQASTQCRPVSRKHW